MTKEELDQISSQLAAVSAKHKEAVKQYRAEHGEPNWKKLVGNYYRFGGLVYRAVGTHAQGITLLSMERDFRHDSSGQYPIIEFQQWTWPMDGTRADMTPISCEEYAAAVAPILSEILKLAGVRKADLTIEKPTHV